MKRIFPILICLISLCGISMAGTSPLKMEFGPWIQNVTDTSFTVLWTTVDKTLSWVECSEDNGTTWNQSSNHRRYFQVIDGRKFYGRFHAVTVSGLKKATRYQYRIVGKPITDDSNPYAYSYDAERVATKVHIVKTLDASAAECNFSEVNDIHSQADRYKALVSGMNLEKTDFLLLNGDMVSFSNSFDTLIKHTFDPISDVSGDIPIFFARGNHEGRGTDWYRLREAFPTSTGKYYYTFRQGPVGFIVLDGGEDKPDIDPEYSDQAAYDQYRAEELNWLKAAVKSPEIASAPVKICIIHIPAFTGPGVWYTQHWITENFTPVLNAAGIDLMLSAHHHKWMVAEKGEHGNNFPILVNSSVERLDVHATAKVIEIRTFGLDGKQVHSYTVNK